MINLIVPITENLEEYVEFVKKHNNKQTKIYVGLTEELHKSWKKIPGVEVRIYNNEANREQILNALHKIPKKKGELFVVRRPLTDEEYENLVSSAYDVSTLKRKHNKFVSFFKNLARNIIRKIFAFSYFEDISAVRYSEDMHELVESFPNLSMASRINRYVGLDVEEIETEQKPAKPLYDKFYNGMWLALAILFLVTSIFDGVLIFIMVPNIWVLWALLIIAWWIIALTILCVVLLKFTRTRAVGDLYYDFAEEVGRESAEQVEKQNVEAEQTKTLATAKAPRKQTKSAKTAKKAQEKKESAKTEEKIATTKKTRTTKKTNQQAEPSTKIKAEKPAGKQVTKKAPAKQTQKKKSEKVEENQPKVEPKKATEKKPAARKPATQVESKTRKRRPRGRRIILNYNKGE